jgi:2-oxoglutarate ferredoxin oxidoreductase subunit alpha
MADFVYDGFDLADKYRNPAMILADGALGQMMEKVEFREYDPAEHVPPKPWATVGKPPTRERNIITSLQLESEDMEKVNLELQEKFRAIEAKEVRFETIMTEDAEVLLVAYGLGARIAQKAVQLARAEGIRAGLLRPITLWPYPYDAVRSLADQVRSILVVEMNAGQMVEDVRLGVEGKIPVSFYGRMGGIIPAPEEVLRELKQMVAKNTTKQVEAT